MVKDGQNNVAHRLEVHEYDVSYTLTSARKFLNDILLSNSRDFNDVNLF